jgi:hypothetical protein
MNMMASVRRAPAAGPRARTVPLDWVRAELEPPAKIGEFGDEFSLPIAVTRVFARYAR